MQSTLTEPDEGGGCGVVIMCCRRVSWCHGGAGYVLTMLKAADVLGDPGGRYSAAAAAAGEDIWKRGLLKKVRGAWRN
jgi:hypothetical protein